VTRLAHRLARVLPIAVLAALAIPAAASAARAPSAITKRANEISTAGARLNAGINPHGQATTFRFEYGTSTAYGNQTGLHGAGNGTKAIRVSAAVSHLTPGTTYHFRIMATSKAGTSFGGDLTFTTTEHAPQVTLTASPSTVIFGRGTLLSGNLTGSRVANRPVVLEQRGAPFKSGFHTVGSPKLTDATGAFGFGIFPILAPVQYRVRTGDNPRGTSSPVTIQVASRVRTDVSSRLVRAHHHVLFSGTVHPAQDGTPFAIQRRRAGLWTTVAGGRLTHNDGSSSQFGIRVSVAHTSFYRVYVRTSGNGFVAGVGRTIHIRIRH